MFKPIPEINEYLLLDIDKVPSLDDIHDKSQICIKAEDVTFYIHATKTLKERISYAKENRLIIGYEKDILLDTTTRKSYLIGSCYIFK